MGRRLLALGFTATLAAGTGAACVDSIDDILYKAVCDSDDDCTSDQHCSWDQGIFDAWGMTPVGWCLRDDDPVCVAGQQPFCSCREENPAEPNQSPCPGYNDLGGTRPFMSMMYAEFAGVEHCVCVPNNTFDHCNFDGTCDMGTPSTPQDDGCFCIP